jgi:hypothetical protein
MGWKQLQKYEIDYHRYIKLIAYIYLIFLIIWKHIFKIHSHFKIGHEIDSVLYNKLNKLLN